MKISIALWLVGTLLTLVPTTTEARKWYLEELPNSETFNVRLGHLPESSSRTPFAKLFPGKWSKAFCRLQYPGFNMTIGQAFGDPCCRWKKGATPDFVIWNTRDFPAQSTLTCAMAKALLP